MLKPIKYLRKWDWNRLTYPSHDVSSELRFSTQGASGAGGQ
jgi:hypothetical protein